MSKNTDYLREGLYFIPLGGSEQFGVNLNVYACDGDLIAVDCGIGFADENLPGIDLLLPDPYFLEERLKDLKALIITHAHEDHVGAVAYLWQRLECPIFTTPFTSVVLAEKLNEEGLKNVPVTICRPGETITAGNFKVQFLAVSHSIPDTCALAIETKHGRVLHSGDWNLDPKPIAGYKTSAADFTAVGDKGVLAYVGDSTNAEVPGRSGTESDTEAGLEKEIRKCKGLVAVTIFSSNIGRIQSIARAAQKCGREVGVVGRSLHKMIGAARICRYLGEIPEFASEEDLYSLPGDKILMIVTGSQGEPRSALARIARGDYNGIKMGKGDTVIFSARPIPGNETNINTVRNNLSSGGVRVVTPSDTEAVIHVSGHPCRDELADMYKWVRPKLVVPVHGERIQLQAQADFAAEQGIGQTIVPVNGAVIRLAPGKPEIVDHVETGLLAVDEKRIISSEHVSISERRKLQFSGAIHVSIAMDANGAIVGDPKLDTVGLLDSENKAEAQIEKKLREEILGLIEDMTDDELVDDKFVAEELRIGLRRFVFHVLGIKPKTTVHVLRI